MARMKSNPLDAIIGKQTEVNQDPVVIESNPEFNASRERAALGIEPTESGGPGRPRSKELIRHGAQAGMTEDFTRVTFIMRVETLNKLKDYAYTERLTLKEALENIVGGFLEDKNDLLPHKKR